MPGKKRKSAREPIRLDDYSHHVLLSLVRIKGNTTSEVGGYIVKQWISDHWEELASYGIRPKVDGEFKS